MMLVVTRQSWACRAAVQAFCGTVQAGVGGGVSLAVGPLGRQADAALRVARSGAAVIYSYCITRGMFAGLCRSVYAHVEQHAADIASCTLQRGVSLVLSSCACIGCSIAACVAGF